MSAHTPKCASGCGHLHNCNTITDSADKPEESEVFVEVEVEPWFTSLDQTSELRPSPAYKLRPRNVAMLDPYSLLLMSDSPESSEEIRPRPSKRELMGLWKLSQKGTGITGAGDRSAFL